MAAIYLKVIMRLSDDPILSYDLLALKGSKLYLLVLFLPANMLHPYEIVKKRNVCLVVI